MPYTGDKYQFCGNSKTCRKRTKWLRCPHCNGKGSGNWSTCGNNCDGGYKCENGIRDKFH